MIVNPDEQYHNEEALLEFCAWQKRGGPAPIMLYDLRFNMSGVMHLNVHYGWIGSQAKRRPATLIALFAETVPDPPWHYFRGTHNDRDVVPGTAVVGGCFYGSGADRWHQEIKKYWAEKENDAASYFYMRAVRGGWQFQ